LFALTVGRTARRVVAIESAGMAADDLAFNSQAAGIDVDVLPGSVEGGVGGGEWTVAVCDPEGVAAVTRTRPRAVAYVACDPASLARDARLLAEAGYDFDYAVPVDMFPQTFHVETVARFQLR
jgi:23S rRNA (uracil1939-C5)-methyltransferase